MQPEIIAALIAAIVSLAGAVVSAVVTRTQLRSERNKLRNELQKEILPHRTAAYAALWKVMITYDLNWNLEKRPLDGAWGDAFLRELNACNAQHGVFFAQPVYLCFVEYRKSLLELHRRASAGEVLQPADLNTLVKISIGEPGRAGLATALKDGLGAYLPDDLQIGSTHHA